MKLPLRVRGAIAFALLAFLLSVTVAALTYQIARAYLLDQRQALVVRQAGLNARTVNAALGSPPTDISSLLGGLPSSGGSHGLARVDGEWYSSSLPFEGEDVPDDVVAATVEGRAVKRIVDIGGTPTMVVGIPLNRASAEYFEVAPLSELQRTLSVLGWSLTAAATITAIAGALLGLYASRRVLRPLREFSAAAEEVGRGHLETRLAVEGDPDLASLGAAFNEMAASLEMRRDRDLRFASDVSHELRNPLTALSAAVDVLDTRADERARPAVDVVRNQVSHFQQLVLDLLELARLDSGQTELRLVDVDPREFVRTTVHSLNGDNVPIVVADSVPATMRLDKRRVERVLVNLLDNAYRHGGHPTLVEVTGGPDMLQVAIEDAGPGIPESEREIVFDRFRRGTHASDDGVRGTGLGLAIVAEHCRAHGGEARAETSRSGGARCVAVFRSPEPV